eukprot:COSAG03_NODE_1611_length_3776_cov_92.161817_2_plen_79_part_00
MSMSHGADMHHTTKLGSNAASHTAYCGSASLVRRFIDKGVDASLKTNADIGDQANMTVPDIANAEGHEDVAALLQDLL